MHQECPKNHPSRNGSLLQRNRSIFPHFQLAWNAFSFFAFETLYDLAGNP